MEVSLDAQTLISLSLRKIHSSRTQRGGIKLHKNLLVSYVLRNARQLYLSERYAELYRRQHHHHHHHRHHHHHHHYHEGGGLVSGLPPPPLLGGAGGGGEGPGCPSAELAAGFVPLHLPADFDGQDGGQSLRSCALARAAEAGEGPVGAAPHEVEPPLGLTPPPSLLFPAAGAPPSGLGRDSPLPAFYPPRLAVASPSAPSGLLYAAGGGGGEFLPSPSALQPPPSGLPPPAAHCPSRTTVLDLDTHVVTTVENGFLHQDCGCTLCPDGCQGGPPTALPPSPGSKRKYHPGHDPETAMAAGGAAEAPPLPPCLPPFAAQTPKRARLEDFNPATCPEAANISNLISIFGSGFTGLVSRPAPSHVPSVAPPLPAPAPMPPPTPTAAPQQTDSEQQQQQQQLLNGQLCSKQALANLGAWTRAIVAF